MSKREGKDGQHLSQLLRDPVYKIMFTEGSITKWSKVLDLENHVYLANDKILYI